MNGLRIASISILLSISLLLIHCQQTRTEIPADQKPNVIFIFPDQYRNCSIGIWSKGNYADHLQGSPDPVNTPNIDKLASEGVLFSRAVSNFPLCSPYRAMLQSGRYPDQNGVTANCHKDRNVSLRSDLTCMTDVFANGGYAVSYFGKTHWLLNTPEFDENGTYIDSTNPPGGHYINEYDTYIPPGKDRHSIEYMVQMIKDVHFDPLVYSSDSVVVEGRKDGELYRPRRFSAEFEAEKIIEYLENNRYQRDSSKPFFMMWSLNPPHNPWTEESTHMDYFDQYLENGEANLDKLLTHGNADHDVGHYAPYYFANVSAVDYYIGTVLDKLEELGMADNTIIVFSSDHGELLGSHGLTGKLFPEAESFQIPFIVKWSKKLEHRVEDLIMSVPDVMPTIAALAGLEKYIPSDVQGKNYSDVLLSPIENQNLKPKNALFLNYTSRGVFTGDYTYIVELESENGAFKEAFCYDNVNDPYQLVRIPISDLDESLASSLKSQLEDLLRETNDNWYQNKICSEYLSYN